MADEIATAVVSKRMANTVQIVVLVALSLPALVALIIVGTACTLWIRGTPMTDDMKTVVSMATAFIFVALPAILSKYVERGIAL